MNIFLRNALGALSSTEVPSVARRNGERSAFPATPRASIFSPQALLVLTDAEERAPGLYSFNRPIPIYYNSYLAPRLRGIN